MKVVFMGSPDFAVPSLQALVDSRHQVAAVVTQPDRPRGRGKKLIPTPVKQLADRLGLPVLQPDKLTSIKNELLAIAPEVIVVVAFGKILSPDVLAIPELGCINVHASLLPRYRGAAPIHRAIINGENVTGVTTMFMDRGLDTGDILLKEKLAIHDQDTVGVLHDRLAEAGARLLLETLQRLKTGTIARTPQNDLESTYASPLTGDDEIVNWQQSSYQIKNLVRGLNPWPGARTTLDGKVLKLWQVKDLGTGGDQCSHSGSILEIDPEQGIVVQTGKGKVLLTELQIQGRRKMTAPEFLRGYQIKTGIVLGEGGEGKVYNE